MFYTRKQLHEEVCRRVDEERRERMLYEALEEVRKKIYELNCRIDKLSCQNTYCCDMCDGK